MKFYANAKTVIKNIIEEIFSYQNLRMPRMNIKEKKIEFNYNIAEYMFYFGTSRRIKLRKFKNTIKTVNIKDYGDNHWEYTKKKIIWARKDDKIKNDIDYDNKILNEMKKIEKARQSKKTDLETKYKVEMFDELNKFKKYSTLEYKNLKSK